MPDTPSTTWIDHLPVIWLEPQTPLPSRRLAIFQAGLSGNKENNLPYLRDLADAGFFALSFDSWEHGERTALTREQVLTRAFGNFRHYMWVNIGQTAIESLRVIDWAIANLGVEPQVCMAGLSMGGDISVSAAGIEPRIRRVAAVGANPITHLSHYAHAPEIRFENGDQDDHVPSEAAFRFKAALTELYPDAGSNVRINLLPGLDHRGVFNANTEWWPDLLVWLA